MPIVGRAHEQRVHDHQVGVGLDALEERRERVDLHLLQAQIHRALHVLLAVAAGKKYVERSVDLRLQKVKIDALAAFLKRIETDPNLVIVNSLLVRPPDDRHQKLDVAMGVSTYE